MAAKPSPRRKASLGVQVVSAFCPVCGHSIPEKRATEHIEGKTSETQDYFDSIEWRDDQPFGMARTAAGPNSFTDWHYLNPEDAPELYDALRQRVIDAVKLWIKRGWIQKEELG